MAATQHLIDVFVADGETVSTELIDANGQVLGRVELRRVGTEIRSVATASFTGAKGTICGVRVHFRQGPVEFPLDNVTPISFGETFTSALVVGNP